jgi:serine phosphatase RsbU (regulator of sigma subunit)
MTSLKKEWSIFFKKNLFLTVTIIITGLLLIDFAFIYKSSVIIEKNKELQRQAERTKLLIPYIVAETLHGIDLGLRGYGVSKNPIFWGAYDGAIKQYLFTLNRIDTLLRQQDYDLKEFNEVKDSVKSYVKFCQLMRSKIENDKQEEFMQMFNEDRGTNVVVAYHKFYENVVRFEDNQIKQAQISYEQTIQQIYLLQILLIAISLPTLAVATYYTKKTFSLSDELKKSEIEKRKIIEKQKDTLEQKVKERTTELENANAEIRSQNEELQQQQEELIVINDNLENKNKLIESQREKIDKQIEELQKTNVKLKANEEILKKSYDKIKEREDKIKEQNAEMIAQNEELHQQQEELHAVNESLVTKNEIIEVQRKSIESAFEQLKMTSSRLNKSIQYAYNIQQIILPKKDKLDSFFQEHFSIYLPKDVVSGDFYWFTKLDNRTAIFVLADCTGHGVPGAFMSMIGNTLLHEIAKTKNIVSPAEILNELHTGIRNILKQEENQNTDGMDISVCFFEKNLSQKEFSITFAGAKSNIFYRKDDLIHQLEGSRITIGGFTERKRAFVNQIVSLKEGEVVYFTSDGYIDQHNVERRRFGTAKFKQLLNDIYTLPIPEQEKALFSTLKSYQQNEEQRDDISVIGIKL